LSPATGHAGLFRSDQAYLGIMTVTVLLFASYAESFGTASLTLDLPEGSRVEDVVATIRDRSAGALPAHPLIAVNQSYANVTDVLRAGDEMAIIPPVAGG
jgi:molybdopterin converting factor subunit 1